MIEYNNTWTMDQADVSAVAGAKQWNSFAAQVEDTLKMTQYNNTTWLMEQADVNIVAAAGQWSSFAIQVDGSNNPVTWITSKPWQEINIPLVEEFGIFVTTQTEYSDGTVMNNYNISRYPAKLGTAYIWTGSNLLVDVNSTIDSNSIQITNGTTQAVSFGLTQLDRTSYTQKPICIDLALPKQPMRYTPLLTIYAKVGKAYQASSIIGDIRSWSKFEISSPNSTFAFDHDTSRWEPTGSQSFAKLSATHHTPVSGATPQPLTVAGAAPVGTEEPAEQVVEASAESYDST